MEGHEHWSLLSAYLDGELTERERSAVDSHLKGCSSCRDELKALVRGKTLMAGAPRRALPADLLAELEERLSSRSWMDALRDWARLPTVWVPAGATAIAAVCLGLWFGLASGRDEELPLDILLAAHSHYSSVGLVPNEAQVASEFSTHMSNYHEHRHEVR